MPLDVALDWHLLDGEDDPMWSDSRVLYALHDPHTDKLLYIGKADRTSVRRRFNCRSKDTIWEFLEEQYDVDDVLVRVAEVYTDARLTSELLADVETLLIKRLSPCCNIACTRSRVQRPGLRVQCGGDWSHERDCFVDR